MRPELKPNLAIARKLYPIVKQKILDFTEFWDNSPNKAELKHDEVKLDLEELTGKNLAEFDLWEYWEADGIENLSFRIALPDPIIITDFQKNELMGVLMKIKTFENPEKYEDDEISMLNWANESSFYRKLIDRNFVNYEHKYFNRNKDKNGNYFEYSVDEIFDFIWRE